MRRPPVQSTLIIAIAAAVLAVLYLFSPSYQGWTQRLQTIKPWRTAEPSIPVAPWALDDPYAETSTAWQPQDLSNTVVVAKMKAEDVSWLDDELAKLVEVRQAVYVVDDLTAPLHTPMNKGNEAMAYLTYLIDFYDDLTDVSTFVHAHTYTWHISELFHRSQSIMISRLNLEKVVRDGYVNMRCELEPGCPASLQLNKQDDDTAPGRMNKVGAIALGQLFPDRSLPDLIAQPCCAQFAISRQAIHQFPKQYYIDLRDWIINTEYPDITSGRIFEYTWHWVFKPEPVFCPDEHLCFCDTFGICFPDAYDWTKYNSMFMTRGILLDERAALPMADDTSARRHELTIMIEGLDTDLDARLQDAFDAGADLSRRQQILSKAWNLLKFRGLL